MTLPDTSTAANQTAGPYWDAAGWCSFGRQARCTRLMYRFAQTKLYANRLVEPGKQTASYIGPRASVARLTWPPAPDRQEGSQGAPIDRRQYAVRR